MRKIYLYEKCMEVERELYLLPPAGIEFSTPCYEFDYKVEPHSMDSLESYAQEVPKELFFRELKNELEFLELHSAAQTICLLKEKEKIDENKWDQYQQILGDSIIFLRKLHEILTGEDK